MGRKEALPVLGAGGHRGRAAAEGAWGRRAAAALGAALFLASLWLLAAPRSGDSAASAPGPAAARAAARAPRCRAGCVGAADAAALQREAADAVAAALYALDDAPERALDELDDDAAEAALATSPLFRQPAGSLADEPYGPDPRSNIPGVQDLHAELEARRVEELARLTPDRHAALAAQARPPPAAVPGLAAASALGNVAALGARVDFLNGLAAAAAAREALGVAACAATAADLAAVQTELLPWLGWHTELGFSKFFLLYDGDDAAAVDALSKIVHVELIHTRAPWAAPADAALWAAYANATARGAAGAGAGAAARTGNFGLMFKQNFVQEQALRRAHAGRLDWLVHLDPDELLLPGGPALSATAALAAAPAHVPALRFMNFEATAEAGPISNRFEQVSLFRVHKHFIAPEAHYYRARYKLGEASAFLYLYANGKSAVRVDAPGARPAGPHYWAGDAAPRWAAAGNPRGEFRHAVSDDTVVLHYAYSSAAEVAAKARRSCPDEFLERARAGDRAAVKRACFVIDHDADAYMAAAAGPAAVEDFWWSRMALTEGSPFRCANPADGRAGFCNVRGVERLKALLTKLGLLRRVLEPQAVLRAHERAIQALVAAGAAAPAP
jgi:hypothetical protein